jgi:hypothetical protein
MLQLAALIACALLAALFAMAATEALRALRKPPEPVGALVYLKFLDGPLRGRERTAPYWPYYYRHIASETTYRHIGFGEYIVTEDNPL